jgi:hypothetical protein
MAVLGSLGIHAFRDEDKQFQRTSKVRSNFARDKLHQEFDHFPAFMEPCLVYTPGMYFYGTLFVIDLVAWRRVHLGRLLVQEEGIS